MFTNAIVRTPCRNLVNGLTTADFGKPDYELALEQHCKYISALEKCGLNVYVLDADEEFPDSTFVEDTAVITKSFAVITNPGAPSRKGETVKTLKTLRDFYPDIHMIKSPGTLDGGDVMKAGSHYYIGISERTNHEGAGQLIALLSQYGYSGSTVSFRGGLHLKSGLSYLENNNLLSISSFIDKPEFEKFNKLRVDDNESYAANSLWINGNVLIPSGYPAVSRMIELAGYNIIEADVSEFRKLDGGLSCLSLRF